ncbi:MAG: PaaI family thioesterase [Desulfofustis sp.]|nr:PaaI family thioesterase [Desulfofustis sp.]
MIRIFGLMKIPLIFYEKPSVVAVDEEKIVVKIPFRRRNRNHHNSIYFGALCVGADCAGGLLAMKYIEKRPERIALVFKDFQADFLKRAEGDTFFICEQGREISALVDRASRSEDRQEMMVNVTATVPTRFGDEPVAKFTMTLSLKRR